jgi:rhomboid protease GluP
MERLMQLQAAQQQVSDCLERLKARTPFPLVNRGLCIANLAVFAVMILGGVSAFNPTVDDLRAWGALSAADVFAGQWWRLLTAMFLHIGVIHLLLNLWALWSLGPLVERLLGNGVFTVTYVTSGLLGSLASLLWHEHTVSAGASGAIFGLVGGLLGFCVRQRGALPATLLSPIRSAAVAFVVVNGVLTISVPGIDMAAHLGGLLGGIICGYCLAQPLVASEPRTLRPASIQTL